MKIGKVISLESNEKFDIEIDDDFLEFFVDALRGAKPVGKSKTYDEDYQDGLQSTIAFGKHKGKTWENVLKSEPDYIQWACDNVERIPEWFKKILKGEDQPGF